MASVPTVRGAFVFSEAGGRHSHIPVQQLAPSATAFTEPQALSTSSPAFAEQHRSFAVVSGQHSEGLARNPQGARWITYTPTRAHSHSYSASPPFPIGQVPMPSPSYQSERYAYPVTFEPRPQMGSAPIHEKELDREEFETICNIAWEQFFKSKDCISRLEHYYQTHLKSPGERERVRKIQENSLYRTIVCIGCLKKGSKWLMENQEAPPRSCAAYAHSIAELFWHRIFKFEHYGKRTCPYRFFDACVKSQDSFRGWECNFSHEDLFRKVSLGDKDLIQWSDGRSLVFPHIAHYQVIKKTIFDEFEMLKKSHLLPFEIQSVLLYKLKKKHFEKRDFKTQICKNFVNSSLCYTRSCPFAHSYTYFFLANLFLHPGFKTKRCEKPHRKNEEMFCEDVHPGEPTRLVGIKRHVCLQWPNGDYFEFNLEPGCIDADPKITDTLGKRQLVWLNGDHGLFTLGPSHYTQKQPRTEDEAKKKEDGIR